MEDGALKGFQLYMAENMEEFPGTPEESQRDALSSWKSLDKNLKEKYKSPRYVSLTRLYFIPNLIGHFPNPLTL